jgi:SprT protein
MLEGLIPGAALERIAWACSEDDIRLKITRGRATKTGDFRPPKSGKVCIITVNGNMNPYASLITVVHELAHYQVYRSQMASFNPFKKYRRRYPPHGKEWKATFRALMFEYMTEEVFPAPVLDALLIYMEHPTASTFANQRLVRALAQHDLHTGLVTIESLPDGAMFKTTTGRTFRKMEKRRTRYLCYCLDNKQKYTFSPIAQVIPEDR